MDTRKLWEALNLYFTAEKHLNAGEINYLKIFKCDDCHRKRHRQHEG